MDEVWEAMKREHAPKPRQKKTLGAASVPRTLSTEPSAMLVASSAPFGSADDLVIHCQRTINSLSDESQSVRKRAAATLEATLASIDTPMLHAAFPSFAKPLFKRFNDPVEMVREICLRLCTRFLRGYRDLLPLLPYLVPAVCNRIGSTWEYDEKLNIFVQDATLLAAHNRGRLFLPESEVQRVKPREPSEEIRLLFLELLQTLLHAAFEHDAASLLNAYVYDILRVVVYGLHDPFPSAIIKACEITVLTSLNLVSVIKHFAVAFVRATKHLLEHRLSKVRVAAMLCIRTVVLVPNVDKCKGAGSEAIFDLVAHQDENVIPVSAFYNPDVKINYFAKLDQDASVLVRQTFFDTVITWLLDLPDRYDFESRLMPYLLSAVADECPDISAKAIQTIDVLGKRHAAEHPDDVIERTQYAVDGSLFCNFTKPYPAPFTGRPSLGTRLYIRGRCRRFINTLLRELGNWQGPTRVHASRLLVCLLAYCEDTITVDLHVIIPHLIRCWDDVLIRDHTRNIADLCGRFTQPASYVALLLPHIQGETPVLKITQSLDILRVFLDGMNQTNRKSFLAQLPTLTDALGARFLLNAKTMQPALVALLDSIVRHLQGITNLATDPSFESQGRLVSKALLFERLFRILLTLPRANPIVQSTMVGFQALSGGSPKVGIIYDAYFEPTWAHLQVAYPIMEWVDWSGECCEHRMLVALLENCSTTCFDAHEKAIWSFLERIWHADKGETTELELKKADRHAVLKTLVDRLVEKMERTDDDNCLANLHSLQRAIEADTPLAHRTQAA
ncbi:Aste57867_15823 [Aphanomyces stellatus]|uniref:Aste57867_15823 protein n=1 Tax=Aphanomyces stellatus TaxID=120398 RepID=A0A485L4Z9_9STRA|nr:hypothetical protein As57867_015767 [Aphanomyces stellatus]VFT92611.1 Aste57867_15823 [Aphanomyces stellatus]